MRAVRVANRIDSPGSRGGAAGLQPQIQLAVAAPRQGGRAIVRRRRPRGHAAGLARVQRVAHDRRDRARRARRDLRQAGIEGRRGESAPVRAVRSAPSGVRGEVGIGALLQVQGQLASCRDLRPQVIRRVDVQVLAVRPGRRGERSREAAAAGRRLGHRKLLRGRYRDGAALRCRVALHGQLMSRRLHVRHRQQPRRQQPLGLDRHVSRHRDRQLGAVGVDPDPAPHDDLASVHGGRELLGRVGPEGVQRLRAGRALAAP